MVARRIATGFVTVLGLALLLLGGLYLWLDTSPGRAFVAKRIAAYEFENGLNIRIGRIEGSIYRKAVLKDVRFRDPDGVFATLPVLTLDWHPFAYLRGGVEVDALTAPTMQVSRLPAFRMVPDRGEPFLPDLDIAIGRLRIDRIVFAKGIVGDEQVASLQGRARIADRRAVVHASAGTLRGDRLTLQLDAVPDDNLLDIALDLDAPARGLVAGLVGKEAPITATLGGKGSWRKWDGALKASVGADPLANLVLAARQGRFTAKGRLQPARILGDGPFGRALSPVTDIDLSASFRKRVADINGSLASAALTLKVDGIIDMAQGTFDDLTVGFHLPRPAMLARNVGGSKVAGKLLFNGAFAGPTIAYNLAAERLAFNDTVIEGFVATGEVQGQSDRTLIPIAAHARRLTGLNAAVGGPLTNVQLDGDLAYANRRILSDNIRIRSDRIDATAIVVGDIDKGIYTGGLKGRVNDYRIEAVGLFNVEADVDLKSGMRSGFALTGTVRGRSTRLFSPGVQNFLGGQMLVNAGIRYGTDGVLRVTRANVVAPQFRLNQGSGSYASDGGRVIFNGSGYSNRYGPVAIALTGTFERPVARVTAARPGFGVGLSNVKALLTRGKGGYAVDLTGGTDYGPVSGSFAILSDNGPLTIDIKRGDIAGIGMSGRVRQTPSGPFAGVLRANGAGFDGTITVSAEGKYQRAKLLGTARDAQLQGAERFSIGHGIFDADIVLYERPQVVADVQVADAFIQDVAIAAARGRINYRGGAGSAQILAEGRSHAPFRIAANARLEPRLWRIAVKGRANSVDFSTVRPFRIVPERSGYEILPGTVTVGNGVITLAGHYGNGLDLQSRLDRVDLNILNAMFSGLEFGGQASGSIDWSQASFAAFPHADARLEITRFTRNDLGVVSQPVEISLVGRLQPAGGSARAIIRRRGGVVGRLQLDLKPMPAGHADWTARLLAAPLSGGIRYNGPAETLFSLAALPDQNLSGNIGIAADFHGRLQQPQLTGVVRGNNLVYENETYGTRLTQLRVRGTFTDDQLEVTELSARAGKGKISGRGYINLSSAKGFPVQLNLDLDGARVARSEMISSEATGSVSVTNAPGGDALIKGTLHLPETRFKIVRQGAAKVTTLTGIRRKTVAGRPRVSGDADPVRSLPGNWKLDINLIADDELYVTGMGLESEWQASLRITGTSDAPKIAGDMELVRGTLGFAGRSFELESGRLSFNGAAATNPSLRVSAASEIDGTNVRVNISGTGNNPEISFSSNPVLPQDEIMARILFGNSVGELSALQAVQLAASLNSLRAGSGGLNPLSVLQSATRIDRLRIMEADAATGRGTSVAVGKYITNDVYVEIVTDARGYTASQIEISLTPALSLLSQISSFGTSNASIRYRKDY